MGSDRQQFSWRQPTPRGGFGLLQRRSYRQAGRKYVTFAIRTSPDFPNETGNLTPSQLIFRCRKDAPSARKSGRRLPVVPCWFEGKAVMAINLVSLVSQFLTPQIVGSLARALGVNEAVAQKVVAAAVPAILASLGTAAAAPGGAQKISDAISNSDPDILTKLGQAASGGNTRFLNEGSNLLSGLLGGGGLATLAGAISQYSGAPHPATQTLLGTATQAAIGTIGQQDPSNWSDPSAILSMLNSQKGAISAALPPEVSKLLGASGLLAGLGGAAAAATQTATSTVSSAATAASSTASSTARSAEAAASRVTAPVVAPTSSGFPMWAIILIVIVVLLAIWWFMTQNQKPVEPAKTGLLSAPVEYALRTTPSWAGPTHD